MHNNNKSTPDDTAWDDVHRDLRQNWWGLRKVPIPALIIGFISAWRASTVLDWLETFGLSLSALFMLWVIYLFVRAPYVQRDDAREQLAEAKMAMTQQDQETQEALAVAQAAMNEERNQARAELAELQKFLKDATTSDQLPGTHMSPLIIPPGWNAIIRSAKSPRPGELVPPGYEVTMDPESASVGGSTAAGVDNRVFGNGSSSVQGHGNVAGTCPWGQRTFIQ